MERKYGLDIKECEGTMFYFVLVTYVLKEINVEAFIGATTMFSRICF